MGLPFLAPGFLRRRRRFVHRGVLHPRSEPLDGHPWRLAQAQGGGQTAPVLFSFTSTCSRLGVQPWAYLQDVLTRLPTTPAEQLGDLLPDHW
jgi:hypothetical protein